MTVATNSRHKLGYMNPGYKSPVESSRRPGHQRGRKHNIRIVWGKSSPTNTAADTEPANHPRDWHSKHCTGYHLHRVWDRYTAVPLVFRNGGGLRDGVLLPAPTALGLRFVPKPGVVWGHAGHLDPANPADNPGEGWCRVRVCGYTPGGGGAVPPHGGVSAGHALAIFAPGGQGFADPADDLLERVIFQRDLTDHQVVFHQTCLPQI